MSQRSIEHLPPFGRGQKALNFQGALCDGDLSHTSTMRQSDIEPIRQDQHFLILSLSLTNGAPHAY